MKKSIRFLALLASVCLIGAAAPALAENGSPLSLTVGTGQKNYINNIETKSVEVRDNRMIVSDFGVRSTDSGGEQKNGALYLYEENELLLTYRPETGNFNPEKAVFGADESVYCLSNGLLLKIDLTENTSETLGTRVGDFQFVGERLFVLVGDETDTKEYHIKEYTGSGFGESLFTVINPVSSFATDGTSFWYFGQKTTAESAKLYKDSEEIPYTPGTPSKLALCGDTLFTLAGNRLYADGVSVGDRLCTSFEVCGDVLYLLSNNRIEGFRYRNGSLVSSGFLFSKAGNRGTPGEISAPADMAGSWILDTDFASVVGKEQVFALADIEESAQNRTAEDAFGIAAAGEILWLACPDGVFCFDTESGKAEFFALGGVRAIAVSAGGELYASAAGKLWLKTPDGTEFEAYRDSFDAEAIAVSSRNNRLYALKEGKITIFGNTEIEDTELAAELAGATDFAIDFENQIFALCGQALRRVSQDGETVTELALARPGLLDGYGTGFNAICLDDSTGEIFLPDSALSLVFSLSKEQSGAAISSEIPALSIAVDPFDQKLNAACARVRINGYPSTLLYPATTADGSSSADPAGKIGEIPSGAEVLVLGEARDDVGGYLFVCARLQGGLVFGFVIDTNLSEISPSAPPFAVGHTGFETEIYKYPDTDTRFVSRTLGKDTKLTVENSPFEGWLHVTLEDGSKGFVRRSAVLEKVSVSIDDRKNASTVGVGGGSPLYREANLQSEVIATLPDKNKVKIISRTGAFAYVETEDHIFGYIESRFLVEEGFSNSQKIGIILLVSCAVLGALTILIRKKIIH